ncbi:cryptochrome/photolyase family protein [Paenibacillus thalictri]|uniref:Deoxyribodipyrimidine photo-lyase n=1 Tax=Paenibacillus thalictri TaxID=2527873 RepID=A0A4Q9DHZ8_9BACL|nr:deoxyribodipyrimidine photo-lyase [Paenibacillus thalictri]TBL72633.1 deoxyribodipyrimidine photo-lyase [Paenibacillus thalictri]
MILFIHRKDLRVSDLPAFEYIHRLGSPSLHVIILDPALLGQNRHLEHSGIHFLRQVQRLRQQYRDCGRRLHVLYGEPLGVVKQLVSRHPGIAEIVCHGDCTPYALQRDRNLQDWAAETGRKFTSFADQALADLPDFQQWSGRSEPYKIFTPFYRKWREYVGLFHRPASSVHVGQLHTADLAADTAELLIPPFQLESYEPDTDPAPCLASFLEEKLSGYAQRRDRFASDETSGLSRYMNTGALSIRTIYEALLERELYEDWLRQLAWRDFYLYQASADPLFFRYEHTYDMSALSDRHFEVWCEGRTGIPIVDAAMTELNATGSMPNRLRMVTSMFLTKNLLCPFPLGEQYFRRKLSDYDRTLNRGGWLWSSSLGFDAAPYFRMMNPVIQSETHDPAGTYIRRWLPELAHLSDREIHRPQPHAIVDLKQSRTRAIEVYKRILQGAH